MALEEFLGPQEVNLIHFPPGGLRAVLEDYLVSVDFRHRELLVANVAEFAISVLARPGVEAPYPVDAGMATYVAHKSNTLTYTCLDLHWQAEQIRPEYLFLFTSDCWKLREILRQEPVMLLAKQPEVVWQQIMESGWRFLPGVSSSHAIARETVFLWSAKAIILTDPILNDDSLRQKLRTAARRLGMAEQAPPAVAVVSR